MKKTGLFVSLATLILGCNSDKNSSKETFTTGTTNIMIEESVVPLSEDIISVFKNYYDEADFHISVSSEAQLLNYLYNDSVRLAIIPRNLTAQEISYLKENAATPRITPIAKEAIVFIGNRKNNDTLIRMEDLIQQIQQNSNERIIVFDNINSSLARKFKEDAKLTQESKNVYYMKNTKEVIEYISTNSKAIGIIGSNWLAQPDESIQKYKSSIRGLYVYNDSLQKYIRATQSTITDNTYPLTRTINIIDIKGNYGLGRGLASFAASDKGQRIVLKAGLTPITMPPREILINQQ